MSLSFLEACKIVSSVSEYGTADFILASSGQTEKLDVFIKACCLLSGFNASYSTIPFNTLNQYILDRKPSSLHHVFLLYPWDLVPELDWRTGFANKKFNYRKACKKAVDFLSKLSRFESYQIIYIPAATPPITRDLLCQQTLSNKLLAYIRNQSGIILSEDDFSLSSYLANGCAIASAQLYTVARSIADNCKMSATSEKKIIVTDFDNVLWKGVIGEDGIDNIHCDQDGSGYIHYIYQSILKMLKQEGVLIAGVTRNDDLLAKSPFQAGKTAFNYDDFISVIASYNAKSAQIKHLAEVLNLPLDSFVFVDDNPLEIEEVSKQLPKVTCMTFPRKSEEFIEFSATLQKAFLSSEFSNEDSNRTEMYRARAESIAASHASGSDITDFLLSLNMQLTIHHCMPGNHHRALQLINKTNQFNLNGCRLTQDEVINILSNEDSSLITFSLKDKYGEHGQICSMLIQNGNRISHFVLSCRVFQRKIEYAAILLAAKLLNRNTLIFDYCKTNKNLPLTDFFKEAQIINNPQNNCYEVCCTFFYEKYHPVLSLFNVIDES